MLNMRLVGIGLPILFSDCVSICILACDKEYYVGNPMRTIIV